MITKRVQKSGSTGKAGRASVQVDRAHIDILGSYTNYARRQVAFSLPQENTKIAYCQKCRLNSKKATQTVAYSATHCLEGHKLPAPKRKPAT
jgi:hypothetical protein